MFKIYNRIDHIAGNVIAIEAEGIAYGELAVVTSSRGKSLAQVIRIDGSTVHLQVFAGGAGVATTDEVRFLGRSMQVSFSENLLGRILNGSGVPLESSAFDVDASAFFQNATEDWKSTGISFVPVFQYSIPQTFSTDTNTTDRR
jgi:vacuolar-type H+-ATPase subunit B/Vma2